MIKSLNSRIYGFSFGALSTIMGVLSGEIISNFHTEWRSPVDSLGNWIIRVIPHSVERIAINLFGVHDKSFLVATILTVAISLGGVSGTLWFAGKREYFYLTILLEFLFSATTVIALPHAGITAIVPSLISGITPILILLSVTYRNGENLRNPIERNTLVTGDSGWVSSDQSSVVVTNHNQQIASNVSEKFGGHLKTRRQLFQLTGATILFGGIMVYGGESLKKRGLNLINRLALKLPAPANPLPHLPNDPAKHIPGLSQLVTPNKDFFQIDTAINPPVIDADKWILTINGMVKNPLSLTYEELLKRPLFELDDTISCVSNPVGGPLVGNARWLGCRLDDLIREAGPLTSADQVLGSSSDGFSAGFPLSTLDGRGAMIAVGMNGEPLPIKHGYPARIIVPGLYGYVSATKWLTNIEITRFDKKQGFWISRGWAPKAPIKMESRIDFPQSESVIQQSEITIAGVAWAPDSGVGAVQVSIDGQWTNATLGPELSGTSWRQWWLTWSPNSGRHVLTVRAIDVNGRIQSESVADVAPNGASGWHSIIVTAQ